MAYVSKEMKQKSKELLTPILKEYGVSGTLSIIHHTTLVLKIKSGSLDFISNHAATMGEDVEKVLSRKEIQVNHYYIKNSFSGICEEFLEKVKDALLGPDFYDFSDPQTDSSNCSHYIRIKIGSFEQPYIFTDKREVLFNEFKKKFKNKNSQEKKIKI